jgi:hypothetical protein
VAIAGLIGATGGWRPAFVVAGAVTVLVGLAAWWYVRDVPREHPGVNDAEAELIEDSHAEEDAMAPAGAGTGRLLDYLRFRSFWAMCFAWMGSNGVFYGLLTWRPIYLAETKGFDLKTIGWSTFVIFGAGFVGEITGGFLADHLRGRGRGLAANRVLRPLLGSAGVLVILALLGVRRQHRRHRHLDGRRSDRSRHRRRLRPRAPLLRRRRRPDDRKRPHPRLQPSAAGLKGIVMITDLHPRRILRAGPGGHGPGTAAQGGRGRSRGGRAVHQRVRRRAGAAGETELGVPVLDSVTVTLWHALSLVGADGATGFGTLLRDGFARSRMQRLCEELLEATGADRTTLRVDVPQHDLHVDLTAAEAHRPGVRSIRREGSLDQRRLDTVEWLEAKGRNLVQPRFGPPSMPPQASTWTRWPAGWAPTAGRTRPTTSSAASSPARWAAPGCSGSSSATTCAPPGSSPGTPSRASRARCRPSPTPATRSARTATATRTRSR